MSAPLTPEEIRDRASIYYDDPNTDKQSTINAFIDGIRQGEQRTAALREELEVLRKVVEPFGGKEGEKPHTAVEHLEAAFPNAKELDWFTPVLIAMCRYACWHTSRANEELVRVADELEEIREAVNPIEGETVIEAVKSLKTTLDETYEGAMKDNEELEAVKKDRQEWEEGAGLLQIKRSEALKERNEAVKLLDEVEKDYSETSPWRKDVQALKCRISSGEMKHADLDNDEILKLHVEMLSSEETKPVQKEYCFCQFNHGVWATALGSICNSCGYYKKDPVPPESLTDKK